MICVSIKCRGMIGMCSFNIPVDDSQYVGDYPDYPTTISIVVGILIIHELRILIHQKYLKGT